MLHLCAIKTINDADGSLNGEMLMMFQAKARNLFEDMKGKYREGVQTFAKSSGVL
jgi:hypothetical protein